MDRYLRPGGMEGNFDDLAAPCSRCSSTSMRRPSPIQNGPVTHVTGPFNRDHFAPASSAFKGP